MSNDFTTILSMVKYVDDSRIAELRGQYFLLQQAADQATQWANDNKITTNVSKIKQHSR